MKKISFQDFVKEVLKGAVYKKGKDVQRRSERFQTIKSTDENSPACGGTKHFVQLED